MAKQTAPDHPEPRKGVTPPKGRPTRSRNGTYADRRVFGPVAQWIAAAVFLLLLIVVMIILTDGGDFNPFNSGHSGSVIAPLVASSIGF